MPRKNTLLRIAMASAAAVGLTACNPGPAPEPTADRGDLVAAALAEGEVTYYTTQLQPLNVAIKEGFEAAYPGITVNLVERFTPSALAQRIDADVRATGRIDADVLVAVSDQALVEYLAEVELTQPISAEEFGVGPEYQYGPNGVAYGSLLPIIGYNTEILEAAGADPIASWQDLLQPELRGLIQIADPGSSPTFGGFWSVMYNSEELGEDFIAAMGETEYQPVATSTVGTEQLIAGQAGVLIASVTSQLDPAKEAGHPIDYWFPESPTPIMQTYNMFPTGSANPNAGRLLLEWLWTEEGQLAGLGPGFASVLGDLPTMLPQPTQFQGPPPPFKVQQDQVTILQLLAWN